MCRSRDGHLELGEDLEEEGLEFLVGPVDLVDEEDGRVPVSLMAWRRGRLMRKGGEKMAASFSGQRMALLSSSLSAGAASGSSTRNSAWAASRPS